MLFRTVVLSVPLLLPFSSVCNGLVETCEELQAAFDLTKTQDVDIQINPSDAIACANFTTMSMDSNTLTVESSEDEISFYQSINLYEIRFDVTSGAKLLWIPAVEFHGTEEQDVYGGGVFVGEGSTVRFFNSLEMTDVGVRSVTEESSDFATYELSGGCVYTDGYFRVDGDARFTRCEVGGGGESPPGPGGALYVGAKGSVLFNSDLEISEVSIIDDEGNNGGGIYNKGKVNMKGGAKFDDLRAEYGGAIYNAVGGQMKFRNGAITLFTDCIAFDGYGGAVYNQGYLKFTGPALFVNTDAPSIYISSDGETVLGKNSMFWDNDDVDDPAVFVSSGGKLDIPSSVSFVDNIESDCSTVYYEEDGSCL